MGISQGSKLISKVLSPALQLWLRSQVEQVEFLEVKIQGGDRQILSGYIPGVFLCSRRAVYQGLHLGEVQLQGENIRINIGQIIKGKPLQLLEPIQVSGKIQLTAADVQSSLSSSLLTNGLTDLLIALLENQGITNSRQILSDYQVTWQQIILSSSRFILLGQLMNKQQNISLKIDAKLELINPQTLQLTSIQIEGLPEFSDKSIEELSVDLGSDVNLETLTLEEGQLFCQGGLLIRP